MSDLLHARTTALLEAWAAPDAAQDECREAFLAHLAAEPDGMRRSCPTGHLTGSALVVDAAWAAGLLLLHRRLGRWLQTGGHTDDGDATLAATALREAAEESGIGGLLLAGDAPVDLDLHRLECPRGHPNRHLDVRWLAVAPAGAEPAGNDESLALRWFPLEALAAGGVDVVVDDSVRRLAGRALAARP